MSGVSTLVSIKFSCAKVNSISGIGMGHKVKIDRLNAKGVVVGINKDTSFTVVFFSGRRGIVPGDLVVTKKKVLSISFSLASLGTVVTPSM